MLSCLSKLLEKIIKQKIESHIDEYNIYPAYQFGFRPGHTTIHQIVRIKQHILDKLAAKKSTGLVLLDIEKAFDTVWHDALIYKLIKFNFPIPIVKLIQNFLKDRKFAVHLGKSKSCLYSVSSGVPQGSVLGPILFNVYVSDTPQLDSNTHLAMFADDTALVSSSIFAQDALISLQNSLNLIDQYFVKWKIKINATKSQAIWFTRRKKPCYLPNVNLQLCSYDIEWSDECKYLGIILDKKLTFQKHIAYTIHKINITTRVLYPFINRKSSLSMHNKMLIFKTIFQAILVYGAPAWFDCAKSHIKKLQICQNKILKMILRLPWHYSTNRLHDMGNVNTIIHLVNRSQEIFFLKCSFSENELIVQLTNRNVT